MTHKKGEYHEYFNFPRLSDSQCSRIHEASLKILEHIGVKLDHQEAIDLLKKAGARISDSSIVHIPLRLVEKAFKSTPKQVVLHDRYGNPVMPVGGYRCFYGPGSDCLNIIDHRTGKRRDPLLKDAEECVMLCDSLTNIDFVMSMVLPSDVDRTIADRYQMEAMLTHTIKPIIFVTYEMSGCRDVIEMAEAVVGGENELRKRPIAACYINAVSGLRHNKEALQKLLFLAEKNLPAIYIPSSTAAVTSPVTPAGSLALDYAGVIAGLVLAQLKNEGAPVIVTGMPPGGTLDMKTLVTSYCEPERTIAQAMSHYYGLPMFSLGGASESKATDQQAAAEAAVSLVVETLAGGNIIHDLGYLESGLTFSMSQLVLCDEIVSWLKAFTKNFEVNDETLALDVIAKVGHDGQFLDIPHTLRHYKERWYPHFFERCSHDAWLAAGGKSFADRAKEKIDKILAEHKAKPLSHEVKGKLKDVIQRASTG